MTGWIASTEVRLRIEGGNEIDEIADLWDWLRGERTWSGAVRAVRTAPSEGELGGAFDVLAVALGSGGAGVALAKSLTVWLRTRRPSVAITVTTSTQKVTVEARNVDRTDILPLLERVLSDGDG